MSAPAHAVRIARVEVVRAVRKHTDDAASAAGLAVLGLLVAATAAGGGSLARVAGRQLRTGGELTTLPVVAGLRGAVALFWLLAVGTLSARAFGRRGSVDAAAGRLVVVPTREVAAGLVLSEVVLAVAWTVVPALAVGAGLALGSGTAAPAAAVPVAVVALVATAGAVAYPAGLAVRHVVTRFPVVARHRNALVVLVVLGYIGLLVSGTLDRVALALFEPMQRTPAGWFADLALVGAPGVAPSAARAAGALALPLVVAPPSVAAATLVAGRHWFSDHVLAGDDRRPDAAPGAGEATGGHLQAADRGREAAPGVRGLGRLRDAIERAVGRSTAALVVLAYRRAYRAPLKLLYAAYPLFLAVGFAPSVLESGRVPAAAPVAMLLFVAWGAGTAFVLNPLGDQGAGLPAALLSSVTGRSFVAAHVLASLLVAVPLGVVATAAVAWASPLGPGESVVAVAAAPAVATLGSAVAVGIGTAFPRFEAVNVTRSTEAVVPSRTAFLLFTGYLLATTGAGALVAGPAARTVVAALLSAVAPAWLALAPGDLLVVAGVALAASALAPVVAYRYAVARFERYTLA